ncbi:MAG TPA: glycosyltransferase [Williamwhitmania sp.]|nr:glycosyltransferase [Williamwhitmania sp.]
MDNLNSKIFFVSFWNPTPENPGKGIFIHEQAIVLSQTFQNFYFIEVNIGTNGNKIFEITSELNSFGKGHRLKITISSLFWKIIYQIPKFSEVIIWNEINKHKLQGNIHIIHANVVFPGGVVCLGLAKKAKARLIISEHWSKVNLKIRNPYWGYQIKKTYNSAETVICVSDWLKHLIQEISPQANISIIPNIVSTEYFYPKTSSKASNEYCFCCVATWELPKRLDLIIASLKEFAMESDKKIILNIVGEGSQLKQVDEDDLFNNFLVKKLGYLNKVTLGEILRSSDYFIHASNIETFSIVVAEALSCGLPVIASSVGALPQIINIDNGILCNNTIKDWINGVRTIVSNKYNKRTICENSKIYSPDNFVKQISNLY